MTGTQLSLAQGALLTFLLALTRTAAFVLLTPPFNARYVPGRVRAQLALALALPLAFSRYQAGAGFTSEQVLRQVVAEFATGVVLGFFVLAAVTTVQAAGDLIDTVGGFQMSVSLDPLLLVQTSVIGRLYQLVVLTCLMVGDGHLIVLRGLYTAVAWPDLTVASAGELARGASTATAQLALGAVLIAGPVLAVMLLADLTLGLLTRAAPALNAFSLGFPLKVLLTLVITGFLVVRLPGQLDQVVRVTVTAFAGFVGAG
jgi:flagellar biosynthetic protein FliR